MIIIEAGEYEITKSITVPENITLAILQGAVLNISEGQTLEILSTDVSYFAPTEIFNGKVTLKNAAYALSEWFGAKRNVNDDSSKAVEAAIESGASVVRLLGGEYIFEGKASVNEGASVKVIGEGHGKTYLFARNKITYFALNAADGDSFAVSSR